jgi:osmotically-inducible protein OsmY
MKPSVSDATLREAVVRELERDPEVVAKHISVTASHGAVTLGGHVAMIHEKHVAVRAAERVEAVRAVADDIEVREPSLHDRADDEIAGEIAHLRGAGGPIPDSVGVQVRDARVVLHGDVASGDQRDAAESAVRHLAGVHIVDNLIKVKTQAEHSVSDVERRVREAIARTADLDARSIEVRMDNGIAHLSGQVVTSVALQVALDAAEAAPGVTAVESAIVVTSQRAQPS